MLMLRSLVTHFTLGLGHGLPKVFADSIIFRICHQPPPPSQEAEMTYLHYLGAISSRDQPIQTEAKAKYHPAIHQSPTM